MKKPQGSNERQQTMPVGVVLERRRIDHPWQEWEWAVTAVIPGAPEIVAARVLQTSGKVTQYHAATLPLDLHRKETEAYMYNLQSPVPSIFAVLREYEDGDVPVEADGEPLPVYVHLVTASPYEAQDYLDSGEETVDAMAMPDGIRDWIEAFIAMHHVEEEFIKRKRDKVQIEDQKFGKEPIFDQPKRVLSEAEDE